MKPNPIGPVRRYRFHHGPTDVEGTRKKMVDGGFIDVIAGTETIYFSCAMPNELDHEMYVADRVKECLNWRPDVRCMEKLW